MRHRTLPIVLASTMLAAAALAATPIPPPQPRPSVSPPAAPQPPRDSIPPMSPPIRVAVPSPSRSPDSTLTSGDVPAYWRTRAERTNYRETPDYDETLRYCRQIEGGSRWVKLVTYGRSGQGRDLPLLILSKDRAFTPEAARATGKPVVLIQNGIHAGEIEGKDACLALARDIAALRTRASLLDSVTVLILPILSVDAHERRSRYNRINQNGPDEMGWRFTPIGLNLNRDYLKLETPELRALIGSVYTAWWPELLIDNHTTDGADYQHDVTFGWSIGPQVPPTVQAWLDTTFVIHAWDRLRAMGHLPAPYLSFRGPDARSGIDFGASPARFSTGYAPLQSRGAILVETHMLKPYGVRVKVTYDAMVALLQEINARPDALTGAVAQGEAWTLARARATSPIARSFALTTRTTDRADTFAYRGYVAHHEWSAITGAPVPRWTTTPWDSLVPYYHEVVPVVSITQPAGYLIPQEWTGAIETLALHGVRTRRLAKAWADTVEMARVTDWSAAANLFEGHHLNDIRAIHSERMARSFRAGDVWVPLDQRGAGVAIMLLEPRSPDGLLAWNMFDTIFERKEYGEDYVVEPMAQEMLAKDPKLATEFRAALAADTSFARSPEARIDFFYRRSAWGDPEQNLYPVARALRAPPESVLAPATERMIDSPVGRPAR